MSEMSALGWLLHTAFGGGLLLLAGWLASRWVPSPAWRQRVGEWSVTAALVLALLSVAPAWILLPVPLPAHPGGGTRGTESTPEVRAPVSPAPQDAGEEGAAPELAFEWQGGDFILPEASEPAPALAEKKPAEEAVAPPAVRRWMPSAEEAVRVLLLAYAAGAALVLLRWLLGLVGLWWILRGAVSAPARVQSLFAELAAGRRARLVVSRRVQVPFSFGLLWPTVVLPASLAATAREAELRWVLGHELAHLTRRDAWGALLLGLGQVVYYFLPWYWWLARNVRLCQEYLADAAAVRLAGRPEDYAEFLVKYAAAAAPPAGACGVWGKHSDLFRRVCMVLERKTPVEAPRRWVLGVACGLLSLAVLGAGVGLRARAEEKPKADTKEPATEKKAEPKKEEKKDADKKPLPGRPGVGFPVFDDLFKNFPPGAMDPNELKALREQMEQARKEMERAMRGFEDGQPGLRVFPAFPGMQGLPGRGVQRGLARPPQPRLGAKVQSPSATLTEQLDLPKDQGMVLEDLAPNSPAAKAGLKPHDILLELNGKPVPSKVEDFVALLKDIKPNTPVDAVVLRKGKKETVKGLSLPEVKVEKPANPAEVPGLPGGFPNFPALPGGGFGGRLLNPGVGGLGSMTTTSRVGDEFTTRHREGELKITVKGKVEDGKANVREVQIEDQGETKTYDGLEKVPAEYREKVQKLADINVGRAPRKLNKL